jgi:hypothetical protein
LLIVRQTRRRPDAVGDLWKVVRPPQRRLDNRNGGSYTSEARHVKRPDIVDHETNVTGRPIKDARYWRL